MKERKYQKVYCPEKQKVVYKKIERPAGYVEPPKEVKAKPAPRLATFHEEAQAIVRRLKRKI